MGEPVVKKTEKTHKPEFYIWLLANYQLHFYNALLQGQFRDSVVTFSNHDLERITTDLSLGITREFATGVRVSLFYRQRSATLKLPDARKPRWGGIIISKSF